MKNETTISKKILGACVAIPLSIGHLVADDIDLRLQDSPAAVQQTFRSHSMHKPIEQVERFSFDGREIYVAEVRLGRDRDLKIYVSRDGNLLKTRKDVGKASLPGPVKKVLSEREGRIEDIEKETKGGVDIYYVELERRTAGDLNLVVSADGRILEEVVEPRE